MIFSKWVAAGLAVTVWMPGASRAADSDFPLSLAAAQRLAVEHQPQLQAQALAVEAARNSAVSAGQLPDPKLTTGVADLPVDGADRYSLRRDDFTMFTAGVMQDFPRAEKRRLKGQRGEHEAELLEQTLTVSRLMIQREVGTAWLEVWKAEHRRQLLQAAAHEAELQAQAAEIGYTANTLAQSAVLEAQVNLGLLRDEVEDADQQARDARYQLARWLDPDVADQPISSELPAWSEPPPLPQLLEQLHRHPHLNVESKRVELAEDDVALARQAYKPDWGWRWTIATGLTSPTLSASISRSICPSFHTTDRTAISAPSSPSKVRPNSSARTCSANRNRKCAAIGKPCADNRLG